ncbi:helix-turn-helix domain-containing protein [Bacteroides thetaiotaomicron]|uniref:AraC family transcriptional regulator n=1 Tax=Bacteroides thetaiotaomicron TaxID=818 RepID=UPI0021665B7E|nr:helix-turn-helix domain-containing protein [Bacteroides thetaiotaomicron]MCS2713660.1 helix-turn-helix domain-containing protein [Bacteroides thetaiotaomicron]MCS2873859.1 helix-turn-helix domain-containing protein [Bacteroides thetaiotaomicron]MDL2215021.1 helix-turn-helix domain-containing protein [Dysgonomonas sp. OttesenSCG-928-M03]
MTNKSLKRASLEHLTFEEDDIFFDNFILEGNDIFGLEQFPRIIDAAGLCICMDGEIEVILNSQSFHMKKGIMCVVLPNDILHIRRKSADFKGYTVVYTPDFFTSINISSATPIYLYIKDNPCLSLKGTEQSELIRICEYLKEYDSKAEHPYRDDISKHLASVVVYVIIGFYQKGESLRQQPYSRKNVLYFEFMELIAKNYRKQRGIEFYANKLCISSRHLSSICKDITGITAKDCIDKHIITNIQILLVTTDMTISQISDELNFPNASFFVKFFKKQTGITPKGYRDINKT